VKRFWTLSLRVRLMIIGLAGVSTALIMGGLAFFGALTYSVDRTLDTETLNTAQEVAAMVSENRLPSPIPVSGAQVVQVVDAQQRVIGGSLTADRLTRCYCPASWQERWLVKLLSWRAYDSVFQGRCELERSRPHQRRPATQGQSASSSDCPSVTCSPRALRCITLCSSAFRCSSESLASSHGE
jgi:hypothetical protein